MSAPWTRAAVKSRLVAAAETIERTVRRPGPREFGQALPDPVATSLDAWFQQTSADAEAHAGARNRARLGAGAAEIAEADDALRWPAQFVGDEKRRRVLAIYLRATIRGVSWSAAILAAGLAQRSANRWRDDALDAICDGLNRERRRSELIISARKHIESNTKSSRNILLARIES